MPLDEHNGTPAESPTTYVCGGCGCASTEELPACARGVAAHQAPAPGFPDPDWLAYAQVAHGAHPVHGPFLRRLTTEPIPVAPPVAAAPAMTPVPTETCPTCGAVLLPPAEFPYCRACGAPLGARRRR